MNTLVKLLDYSEIRKRWRTSALQQGEIPVEHSVSLPLPTQRWGAPAYAFFASPAVRLPGQPMRISAPDRWWVLGAHGGRLQIYTLWRVLPFAADVQWGQTTVDAQGRTIAEQQQAVAQIETLMDAAVPAFFAGQAGPAATRRALAEVLTGFLPAALLPQYQALAPDFWAWLAA